MLRGRSLLAPGFDHGLSSTPSMSKSYTLRCAPADCVPAAPWLPFGRSWLLPAAPPPRLMLIWPAGLAAIAAAAAAAAAAMPCTPALTGCSAHGNNEARGHIELGAGDEGRRFRSDHLRGAIATCTVAARGLGKADVDPVVVVVVIVVIIVGTSGVGAGASGSPVCTCAPDCAEDVIVLGSAVAILVASKKVAAIVLRAALGVDVLKVTHRLRAGLRSGYEQACATSGVAPTVQARLRSRSVRRADSDFLQLPLQPEGARWRVR
jgi:hypothetical protein